MIRSITRSRFARSVAVLSSGTALAQAIPIAISPILTRLYSPEEFGMVAVYMAIVSMVAVLVTGRYEMAINLPARDEDAASILLLSIKLCCLVAGLLYLPVYCWNDEIADFLGPKDIGPWLYLLPVSVWATGMFNSFQFWCNRKSHYRQMSINRVQMSGLMAALNVGLGFLKIPHGMVIGSIAGQTFSAALVTLQQWWKHRELYRQTDLTMQLYWAKQYKNHPLHVAPAHMIGVGAQQIPLVMMSAAFSASAAGFFSLAYRVVSLPTGIVAASIGDVFRQQASKEYTENGEFKQLFISVLKKTASIACIPFLALYFLLPDIFDIAFGKNWQDAARYAQILLIPSFFQFVITPIDKVFLIYQKTSYEIIIQTLRAVLLIGLFILASTGKFQIEVILGMFAFCMTALYLTILGLACHLVFQNQ